MDQPPSNQYRPRRLAVACVAAVAAALFTPVPATADVISQAQAPEMVRVSAVRAFHTPDRLAQSLISTGMIGIGLAMGGLVIVTHRRRQW